MSTIIVGGFGFIGGAISNELFNSDKFTIIIDPVPREKVKYNARFSNIDHMKSSNLYLNLISKEMKTKPSFLFHLCDNSNIDLLAKSPELVIESLQRLIKSINFCLKNNIKLIYASSYFVQEERTGHFYTTMKLTAERMISDYYNVYEDCNYNYTVLRYGTVYGKRGRGINGVVDTFINDAKTKGVIEVHGDETKKRSFIHVDDIAKLSVAAINRNGFITIQHEVYTIGEVARIVKKCSNCDIKYVREAERPNDFKGKELVFGRDSIYPSLPEPQIKLKDYIRGAFNEDVNNSSD